MRNSTSACAHDAWNGPRDQRDGPFVAHRVARRDDGFTLVELLIVVTILPLLVGALSVMLVSVLSMQTGTGNRLAASSDAQVVTATFVKDVANSTELTTSASAVPTCAAGTRLLGLQFSNGDVVSYLVVANGATSSLVREVCEAGTTSPYSTTTISFDVTASLAQPTLACSATSTSCAIASSEWVSSAGVTSVKFPILEPTSNFNFTISATPSLWNAASGGAAAGGVPMYPFTTFNTGCSVLTLTMNGNAKVNVGGGKGSMIVNSACDHSLQLSGSASINAAGIVTADKSLKSYQASGGSPSPGPIESYQAAQPDPLAALLIPPVNPTAGASTGCPNATPIVCAPGTYATSPSLGANTVATFGSGTYIFTQPVHITSNASVTFDGGTYWFMGGLLVDGAASVTLNNATLLFGNTVSDKSTCGDYCLQVTASGRVSTQAGGALLYVESGGVKISGDSPVSLLGETANYGVALWDVGAVGTDSSLKITASGSVTSGGVYVPYGETNLSGSGQVSVSFLATGTANLSGSGIVNVG